MPLKSSKLSWLLLVSLLVVLLSACGKSGEAVPPADGIAPPQTAVPEETTPPEPATPAYTAPLTGLPLEEPLTRRPLAIMINNAPAARPQSGLIDADVVYEVLAEGGVTRLISIFHSQPDNAKIGPIRSIRPYMIDLGESYRGVLVHAGASNDAYAILQRQHKEDLDEITNAGSFFWRDKSRKAPHNLYSNVEKLLEGAAKRGYATEETAVPAYTFYKENEQPISLETANNVEIKFQLDNYRVSYLYDAATGQYKRSINGEPHTDLESGEQLTAANVIVMGADHQVLDDVGRLDVGLSLGGEAMLFQQGKVTRAEWIRKDGDIIRFIKDNVELPMVPGKTFIHIVPNTPDFSSHVKAE
ncbi:putative lipoprotein YerB precursor [compost metagenome]